MKRSTCQLCRDAVTAGKPVLESAAFAALPSLGALAPGHVLVVPKAHRLRLADLPPEHRPEYAQFLAHTVRTLERTFGAPVHRFEHGSDAAGTVTPCTIDHAHLHLLPAAVDVRPRLAGDYEWRNVDPSRLAAAAGPGEYLYYQSPDGAATVARGGRFTSQYLRRVFAEALGVTEWNWRTDSREATVAETYRRLDAAKIQA